MFKHVQPLNGQGFGVAEALSLYVSGEVKDRFHDQSSIDRAGFLQFLTCTQHGSIRTLNPSLRVLNWLSQAFMRRCVATATIVCNDADAPASWSAAEGLRPIRPQAAIALSGLCPLFTLSSLRSGAHTGFVSPDPGRDGVLVLGDLGVDPAQSCGGHRNGSEARSPGPRPRQRIATRLPMLVRVRVLLRVHGGHRFRQSWAGTELPLLEGRAMTNHAVSPDAERAPKIDTTVPHQARVWNYLLGGKDNYLVDVQAGKAVLAAAPGLVAMSRASRVFLTRAVRYQVEQAGIRQFLDIGTGLPTANNTHEIAQTLAPQSRIVYVDFDPLVLVHARALLTSDPQGATDYIDADLRDTEKILHEAHRTLDFTRPIGIILLGILGAIESYDEARAIVRTLLDAVPAGSYLLVGDGTNTSEAMVEAARVRNESVKPPYIVRSPEQIAGFLDGLEPVEPGVVSFPHWRPEPGSSQRPAHVDGYGGIAYKR